MIKILLLLACIACTVQSPLAQEHAKVDSTLFAYYTHCKSIGSKAEVLQTADTLYRLSEEKSDARMQAVSLSLKADYYYLNNKPDSLKVWISRIYTFGKENDQIRYYFFSWNRLITLYIKACQYTYAQYELERMLHEADAEQYKDGIAQAYSQMGHVFTIRDLDSLAANYYAKAIDYITTNKLASFGLSTAYLRLAGALLNCGKYAQAHQAIEQAEKHIAIPDQIWEVKQQQTIYYALTGKADQALSLLHDIEQNSDGRMEKINIYGLQSSVYKALGMTDEALDATTRQIELYKNLGYKESFYTNQLKNRADFLAEKGLYQQAYKELIHHTKVYREKAEVEGASVFNQFATLFNVSRLNQEKAELEKTAQEERYRRIRSLIIGQSILLLLTALFVVLLVHFTRRLRKAKAEAESASRIKGLFLEHITHELNTPLNAIIGFSDLATTETDNEARYEYLRIIQTNCGYLQKLVENSIYISDIESTQEAPYQSQIDINECCRQSIEQVAKTLPPAVEIRFKPGCKQLFGNSNWSYMQHILNNLLQNAAQFTTQGWIELAYTHNEEAQRLIFTITDTGSGIPATESERIFERFFKLNLFTLGSGLGLTVCREAARRLGGDVWLDTSYTEGGARFVFTLPIGAIRKIQGACNQ